MIIWKVIKWLLKSIIISLFLLIVTNFVGSFINLNIPINIWTIAIVAVLRIPGLAAIILYALLQ